MTVKKEEKCINCGIFHRHSNNCSDQLNLSSSTWEETEREAFRNKFGIGSMEHWDLVHNTVEAVNDYWIERMKKLQEDRLNEQLRISNSGRKLFQEGRSSAFEQSAKEIKEYRETLRFMWRWVSRMNGDKAHDRPETEWKTYLACLVNSPNSPYNTKDWYEDDETSPLLSSLTYLKKNQ